MLSLMFIAIYLRAIYNEKSQSPQPICVHQCISSSYKWQELEVLYDICGLREKKVVQKLEINFKFFTKLLYKKVLN